ncbi:hypothetical protein [Pseudonocardia spinosispora]|uniref:hypothetical protein n=1 Tax=Pseudonocardia spinosispora TaxID=103441 RepID=UPI00040277E0|nr:hypothetical protein [Pseudonocardia spinosispora]
MSTPHPEQNAPDQVHPYAQPAHPQQTYPHQPYPHPVQPAAPSGWNSSTVHDPLMPSDFSGWFQRSIAIVRQHFTQLAIVQFLPVIANAVYLVMLGNLAVDQFTGAMAVAQANAAAARSGAFDPAAVQPGADQLATLSPGFLVTYAAIFLFGVAAAAVSYCVIIRNASGRRTSAVDALPVAMKRYPPLLGWTLLGVVLTYLGMILLIAPGVYLLVALLVPLAGVVVVERAGIGRCFVLTRGRFWATAGRVAIMMLVVWGYGVVVALIAGLIGVGLGMTVGVTVAVTAGAIIASLLSLPAFVYIAATMVVTYAELRAHDTPGVTTSTLAAELAR